MKYYGIDIHKKYSVYTLINEEGVVLERGKIANEPEAFARVMNHSTEKAKAVIEAIGNWYYIHDLLEELIEEVYVAHPQRTKDIASARVKTDKVDATTLAQLLRTDFIPKSFVPSREVRELRELLRYRASLVRMRTRIKNKIHALLTKNGLKHPFSDLFGKAGRKWLTNLELRPVYRNALEGYLRILDVLDREILPVTREINARAPANPGARLLVSIPGIGHCTALLILLVKVDID